MQETSQDLNIEEESSMLNQKPDSKKKYSYYIEGSKKHTVFNKVISKILIQSLSRACS